MDDSLSIKKVHQRDLVTLQDIGKKTFYETFSAFNSRENLSAYLEESFSAEKLSRELNTPDSEFYFALYNTDVIGYLKLNYGNTQTELKDTASLEIERIYVLEAFHGKKAGALLLERALEIARHKQLTYIWLGVWEKNTRALNFYRKHGFVEFDKHVFKLGDDAQTDLLMRLDLKS